MAIIKCKMCGGDLELVPDSTVCECEYCGTRQTVPSADSEKMLSLFHRAGKLLRACEFDKAYGVYESIVNEFPDEAEAYWGLVLCKFGIEYVDDPATGKKVPTCRRAGFESVEDDPNFEQACENADSVARRVYREEGHTIDELRERIIEVSGKEEPYDIFISYKELAEDGERTEDSVLAQDIYDALTAKGYRVFFSRVTLEDKLGVEYEPYIFAALNSAKVMLLVGMDYENLNAVWVKNEWSRYLALMAQHKEKVLIPCYKNMDAYNLPKEVRKLAAQDMGKVGAMQDLLRGVEKIISPKKEEPAPAAPPPVVMSGGPNVTAILDRGFLALEDEEWDKAAGFFDQALNMDARNAEAWLGLAMVDLQLQHETGIAVLPNGQTEIDGNANYRKFLRFASPERNRQVQDMVAAAEARKQKREAEETERIRREAEERRQHQQRAAAARMAMEEAERKARRKEEEALRAELAAARARIAAAQGMIAAGSAHTVCLDADGIVSDFGDKMTKDRRGSDWRDVVAVAAGPFSTIGLKADGTVIAACSHKNVQYDVSAWKGIAAVSAGFAHMIGLKADGTLVAAGKNDDNQCDVSAWEEVVAIAAGDYHTVGLKADGTVLAVGDNQAGQCEVSDWREIVAIAAGYAHTVGLKANGTVVAAGEVVLGMNPIGFGMNVPVIEECSVADWKDIVAIAAGNACTFGLKADGTVVSTGTNDHGERDVDEWKDVVAIASGGNHTVCIKSDGTVDAVGLNHLGQCDMAGGVLFESIDTLREEKAAAKEQYLTDLQAEKQRITEELPRIKGLFAASRQEKLEARLAEIQAELERLR